MLLKVCYKITKFVFDSVFINPKSILRIFDRYRIDNKAQANIIFRENYLSQTREEQKGVDDFDLVKERHIIIDHHSVRHLINVDVERTRRHRLRNLSPLCMRSAEHHAPLHCQFKIIQFQWRWLI